MTSISLERYLMAVYSPACALCGLKNSCCQAHIAARLARNRLLLVAYIILY